jgi:hypothetical protein
MEVWEMDGRKAAVRGYRKKVNGRHAIQGVNRIQPC